MIDAVNVVTQSVATNAIVLFGSTRIATGCSARHEPGSGRFVLLKPGIYEVEFNANVSLPEGATVGPIELDIVQDGEAIAGSKMIFTPAAVDVLGNVSATVLVRVYEQGCCTTLSVRNDSATAVNVQDANFVITRHC